MARKPPKPDEKVDEMLDETFPASDAPSWGGSNAERERRAKNASSANRALRKSGGLQGKTFAILATNGFEQSELMKPRQALLDAGAEVEIVSPGKQPIKGWKKKDWGDEIDVDLDLNAASPSRYDGLVLPGGTLNADALRTEPRAITFIKDFFDNGKPVAAICHAPWLLVEARVVDGHRLTSWPSLKTDVRNAGGEWLDEEVVVDDQLVTSRKPDDIPAFNEAMIGLFAQNKRRSSARTTIGPTDV
ncbi:MAG TPA: type 1 glutamine amidotransferase domain-containing protein [Solimonas sp.]|nr:type 1 glutamine amidotransferase domain-containing protein [Solimonas sp.]